MGLDQEAGLGWPPNPLSHIGKAPALVLTHWISRCFRTVSVLDGGVSHSWGSPKWGHYLKSTHFRSVFRRSMLGAESGKEMRVPTSGLKATI